MQTFRSSQGNVDEAPQGKGKRGRKGGATGNRPGLSRRMILDAAHEIIREGGIAGLSMRTIAARLGCSVAGPYSHFENQEEIIKALIGEGEERLTQQLRKAAGENKGTYDKLEAVARTYHSFAAENRELHKLIFNIGGHRKIFAQISSSYRIYLETIRQGVKNGEIQYSRRGYHALARTMWAWMYGLIVLELTDMLARRKAEGDPVQEGFQFFRRLLLEGEK